MEMTFKQFQQLNAQRCVEKFHREIDEWTPQQWALCIAGEAGELCNVLKKVMRGDVRLFEVRANVIAEIADVMTYCDLLMTRMGVDTASEVARKFNEVSKRVEFQTVIEISPRGKVEIAEGPN
ncbi:MAG TPA: MazG-like family protein, partial [Terracidiphilus sp.]|nr:MazG-like family protein [Terracidiphilus sp.]